MASHRANPSHIERQRVPMESRVSLKFKEFRGFLTEYSRNISLGGMFLATDKPQPPGSVFDFEFKLADEFSLIHGIGEVVWARTRAEGPERPIGMGVRFLHLDGAGEKLIRRMVKEHVEKGGIPFELGDAGELLTEEELLAVQRDQLREDLSAFDPPLPASSSARDIDSVPSDPGPAPMSPGPPEPPGSSEPSGALDDQHALDETMILENPLAAGDPSFPGDQGPIEMPVPGPAAGPVVELDPLSVAVDGSKPLPSAEDSSAPFPGGEDSASLADTAIQPMTAADLAIDAIADSPTAPFRPLSIPESKTDDAKSLPPGFDEVTRALGRAESTLLYADESLNGPRDSTTASPGSEAAKSTPLQSSPLQSAPPPRTEASSGTWRVPDPIAPYEPPHQKKGGNGLVVAVGLAIASLFGIGYYVSTHSAETPAFVSEDIDSTPTTRNESGTLSPHDSASEPSSASSLPSESPSAEPPTLESLVGLPETGDVQEPPSEASAGIEPTSASVARAEPLPNLPDDPPAPASGLPATEIQEVRWEQSDRTTIVTLVGNGAFLEANYSTSRIRGGQPREILYLRGIESGYRTTVIAVGTPSVQRIRLGHHVKPGGPELHIVFDLEHIDAKLFTLQSRGNELVITLGPT